MRFSLTTLILFTLLSASLMAVVMRWTPWVEAESYSPEKLQTEFPERSDHTNGSKSRDGTRYLNGAHSGRSIDVFEIAIFDGKNSEELCRFETKYLFAIFLKDDVLLCSDPFNLNNNKLYRRRHPEWWWGHLYRPEVWLSIVFFFALILHVRYSRKQQNASR